MMLDVNRVRTLAAEGIGPVMSDAVAEDVVHALVKTGSAGTEDREN